MKKIKLSHLLYNLNHAVERAQLMGAESALAAFRFLDLELKKQLAAFLREHDLSRGALIKIDARGQAALEEGGSLILVGDGIEVFLVGGCFTDADDCVFCEDVEEYVHIDHAHYHESVDAWYSYPPAEHACSYGSGVPEYTAGARSASIDGVTVGFEVESLEPLSALTNQALFNSYYETDCSCGYEIESKVFDLYSADLMEAVNDCDLTSVEADARCGGHISIRDARKHGITHDKATRFIFPILAALYPTRLGNSYCCFVGDNYKYSKYSAIKERDDQFLEYRIFPRIDDKRRLGFRLELLRLLYAALVGIDVSSSLDDNFNAFSSVYARVRTHLGSVYSPARMEVKESLILNKIPNVVQLNDYGVVRLVRLEHVWKARAQPLHLVLAQQLCPTQETGAAEEAIIPVALLQRPVDSQEGALIKIPAALLWLVKAATLALIPIGGVGIKCVLWVLKFVLV